MSTVEVHNTLIKSLILNTTQCGIKDVFEHAFLVNFALNSDGCMLINDINKLDNYERYHTKFGDQKYLICYKDKIFLLCDTKCEK